LAFFNFFALGPKMREKCGAGDKLCFWTCLIIPEQVLLLKENNFVLVWYKQQCCNGITFCSYKCCNKLIESIVFSCVSIIIHNYIGAIKFEFFFSKNKFSTSLIFWCLLEIFVSFKNNERKYLLIDR
jgi:hypothetical protein